MKGDFRKKTKKEMELKRLAGRIRDEEHLDSILADARPDFRSAVRSALRPYLRFELREEE